MYAVVLWLYNRRSLCIPLLFTGLMSRYTKASLVNWDIGNILAMDRLSVIWKSDLTDKTKSSLFQAATVSILLYGCSTWTLTKHMKKKLDGNYTRMLRAILNKPWRQHPTKQQLYGHLPPMTKTIKIRRSGRARHCWRSRDELISDVLLWTSSHRRAKIGRLARTYIQQLCADTGCSHEDLPKTMDDNEGWRERVRDIRADSAICWWSWWNVRPLNCSSISWVLNFVSVWDSFLFSYESLLYRGWCSDSKRRI